MSLGDHPIQPDVDPAKDGDKDRSDDAEQKPSAGGATVKDRNKKRGNIECH